MIARNKYYSGQILQLSHECVLFTPLTPNYNIQLFKQFLRIFWLRLCLKSKFIFQDLLFIGFVWNFFKINEFFFFSFASNDFVSFLRFWPRNIGYHICASIKSNMPNTKCRDLQNFYCQLLPFRFFPIC